MQEAFGVQEILKEFRSCRSTDNSLGGGMQEAFGVQEILKEFRSCRSTGVQTIVWETECRRTDSSLGNGMQEDRQ